MHIVVSRSRGSSGCLGSGHQLGVGNSQCASTHVYNAVGRKLPLSLGRKEYE